MRDCGNAGMRECYGYAGMRVEHTLASTLAYEVLCRVCRPAREAVSLRACRPSATLENCRRAYLWGRCEGEQRVFSDTVSAVWRVG